MADGTVRPALRNSPKPAETAPATGNMPLGWENPMRPYGCPADAIDEDVAEALVAANLDLTDVDEWERDTSPSVQLLAEWAACNEDLDAHYDHLDWLEVMGLNSSRGGGR